MQMSRKWTHHITTLLFFGFGLWSLWDGSPPLLIELLYRLLNEHCEIVLSLTEIVHLQQNDLTDFLIFQDSFGRLHDKGYCMM